MNFLEILYKYDNQWLRIAQNLIGSNRAYDARDLVQDMYLKIGEAIASGKKTEQDLLYDDNEPNTFYIFTILRNAHLDNLKMGSRFAIQYDSNKHSEDVEMETRLLCEAIKDALKVLTPRQRRVYELTIESDYTVRSVADAADYSYGTVFNEKKYIKQFLQEWLRDEEI